MPRWSVAWSHQTGGSELKYFLAVVAALFASLCPFSTEASMKPVQTPSGDPNWYCQETTKLGRCIFNLAKLDQPLRVAYPKVVEETHFNVEGVKKGDTLKIEFVVPAEGWGNSLLIMTRGKIPLLFFKEAGVMLDSNRALVVDKKTSIWKELGSIVLFGRGKGPIVPAIQATSEGKYFGTFTVTDAPPHGTIEIMLMSEEFKSSP